MFFFWFCCCCKKDAVSFSFLLHFVLVTKVVQWHPHNSNWLISDNWKKSKKRCLSSRCKGRCIKIEENVQFEWISMKNQIPKNDHCKGVFRLNQTRVNKTKQTLLFLLSSLMQLQIQAKFKIFTILSKKTKNSVVTLTLRVVTHKVCLFFCWIHKHFLCFFHN